MIQLTKRMYKQDLKLSQEELRFDLTVLGCTITSETSLGTRPGSVHWHIKSEHEPRGTLEATWLESGEAWLSYHDNRYQPWMDHVLKQLS
jgi:hypothetical protein